MQTLGILRQFIVGADHGEIFYYSAMLGASVLRLFYRDIRSIWM